MTEPSEITGRIEIDSRKIVAGDVFLALKGENFDGHDFIAQALEKGAVATLSGLDTLEKIAQDKRAKTKAKIIGITGSVGKTSTKEMLRLALSAHGKVHATTGNYNNHIGTPLNLANMPIDVDFGVFEMGMNHAGEISHLTKMVRPHIALITRVEAAHLEFFSGIEEIAKAKAEIFEGLVEGGVRVVNADQEYFCHPREGGDLKLSEDSRLRGNDKTITFGENKNANCRLNSYTPTPTGCDVSAEIFGQKLDYKLAAIGRHWAIISLSVLAVCHALGLDLQKSADALASFSEVEGRGKIIPIKTTTGKYTIIDDSYNASPASMREAFSKTAEVWMAGGKIGRKIAVLGDMLELGESAPEIHKNLAQDLLKNGFDVIHTAGDLMENLHHALPETMRGEHTKTAGELLEIINCHPREGGDLNPQKDSRLRGNDKEKIMLQDSDIVLIKGSHGSKMYELAKKLITNN